MINAASAGFEDDADVEADATPEIAKVAEVPESAPIIPQPEPISIPEYKDLWVASREIAHEYGEDELYDYYTKGSRKNKFT